MGVGDAVIARSGRPQAASHERPKQDDALPPALRLLDGAIDGNALRRAAEASACRRTCPLDELAMLGICDEKTIFRALANALGKPFATDPTSIVLRRADRDIKVGTRAMLVRKGDETHWLVAPSAAQAEALIQNPDAPVTIVPPSLMATLVERARSPQAVDGAVHALHRERPEGSARTVMTARQGFVLAAAICALLAASNVAPLATLVALHVVGLTLFLACIALRIAAAVGGSPPRYPPLERIEERDLPTYSVLAVLYREGPVAAQLIDALDRIRWPRAKLEVLLVCEADDDETLDAIAAHGLPPHMRVVRVPPEGPRTKPKALNHALDAVSGEFVVVYDAEDRPHPFQLREAHQTFRNGPGSLACLQAALQIDNGARSFLSRGFAIEYAALFRGLLPWLAKRGLPLPLGGTSNHFRTRALREVGAWDPFNVTEDADLGFRLYRHGYRIGTVSRPTVEAAPTQWRVWRDQRTRWLKGWAQTWLVHMRSPVRLVREAGWGGFAVLQIAMLGILGSALLHPLMFVAVGSVIVAALADAPLGGLAAWLLALDMVNVLLAYAAMWGLTWSVLRPGERWLLRGSWRLPLYWLCLVPPAWRAMVELMRNPHRWSKTPHEPEAKG